MKFEVTFTGTLIWEPAPGQSLADRDTDLERVFETTMEELVTVGVEDPSVTGIIASGFVEVSLLIDAAEPVAAVDTANGTIRAALHAADVNTAGWEAVAPARIAVTWHKVEADEPVGV